MGLQLNITGQTVHGGALALRGEVIGLDLVERNCRELGELGVKAMAGGLYREMQGILTDAKTIEPRVPVGSPPEDKHPGTLRSSAHVEMPKIEGSVVTVTGGFGGASTPYALAQHERLDFRHPHPGEGAKYLETHLLRRSVDMDGRIAADIASVMLDKHGIVLPPAPAEMAALASANVIGRRRLEAFNKGMLKARTKGWRTLHGDY